MSLISRQLIHTRPASSRRLITSLLSSGHARTIKAPVPTLLLVCEESTLQCQTLFCDQRYSVTGSESSQLHSTLANQIGVDTPTQTERAPIKVDIVSSFSSFES